MGHPCTNAAVWTARMLEACGELLTVRLTGTPEPYCLLCAEKHVADCHRQQIADYLIRHKGAEVTHLEWSFKA